MDLKSLTRRAALTILSSMLCLVAFAQNHQVTGTIRDAAGEPMIGVNVLEKGTTNGTITDFDGNYSLSVDGNGVLVFSYIGFQSQEIAVANKTKIDVTMAEDTETLEEVVVVGYGVMKKNDLTGSVGSVDTEKLVSKGAPTVMESLQGSVPGVNITQSSGRTGGGFNIEIRGRSSTNSDTTPLYVVDGVICDDIDFLNQQDIERIDILKDASSTAIYGSRATAGVVMVTTKSGSGVGQSGARKPTVTYDGYYGIATTPRMPDFQNAEEFARYRLFTFEGWAEGGTTAYANPIYGAADFKQALLYNVERDVNRLNEMLANGETYDWPGLVTRTGAQQNHYLSVSGAGEAVSYHLGVGYQDDKGIYEGDEESKINFKGSVDAKINKYVSAGFNFNMAYMNHDYANDDAIQDAYRMNPFMVPYDANGEPNLRPGNYQSIGSTSGYQFSDQTSPLIAMQNQTRNRETWRLLGNFYLQIAPVEGLTIKSTFSPDYTYYREGEFNDVLLGEEVNSARTETHRGFSWTWDNIVNYTKTFNEKHSLNLMGLFSMTASNSENQDLLYNDVLNGTLWWNMATGTYIAGDDSGNSYSESSMVSAALRANYTFMGKYMLTGTVRWDGSSRFADGHRWGAFPSVAAAWRMSEEDWLKRDWLSNLKLRVSYGITGNNSGIDNYATQTTVSSTPIYYPFGGTYFTGFYPSGIVNRALSWETSKEINVGIDFGFFNNRISGSLDIYQKNAEDLLYDVMLPLEAGTDDKGNPWQMTTNVGKVRNRGIEATLTTINVERNGWHWETTFGIAANQNRVLDINGLEQDLPGESLFIGKPLNNVYAYEYGGVVSNKDMTVPDTQAARDHGFTPGQTVNSAQYYNTVYGLVEGNPIIVDRNGDGTINESDKKVYRSDPAWTGSLSTTLTWNNWDLSATLYTKQNYTVSSDFYGQYLNFTDRGRVRLDVDHYIPAGTLIGVNGVNADGTYIDPVYQATTHYGNYPFPTSAGDGSMNTSYWTSDDGVARLVDASYVKIKNITLGYTFPQKWMNKIRVKSLRLYCTVTNPFVFTDYKGFDPEWANADLDQDGPSTVTWQFGGSIKF